MRILTGLVLCAAAASAANLAPDRIRDAASKAIALLQVPQKDWYAKQSCYSCHNQLMPALAFRVARQHGIPVNEKVAHDDAARGFGPYSSLDRAVQYTHIIDPSMDDNFRLYAMDAVGVRPNLVNAVYARHIALRQRPDGHWVTGDQRPPQAYSYITATAISIRAIQLYHHASLAADTEKRVERARAWLASQQPRDTEERTYQLLGLFWAGASRDELSKRAAELARTQRPDGGWQSVNRRPSDAYSTGEALVALHDAGGMPVNDPVWSRGLQFLTDTQQPDGSWHVVSRLHPPAAVSPPYFESGYPYGHDQFISAMAASWSIMALAESLGPAQKYTAPRVPEAEPKDIEPWAETVLFGTPAELRALLDKKFDPNSATKDGTTALMMAMPDVEKAKLLLDHGAKLNARSKTRYSALLVAAQYPGSSPVMRLLLDHGAEVRLPKGAGAPLFNATVLGLSAMSGNADMIPLLLPKGDRLDDQFISLGLFPGSPFTIPIGFDDVKTMAALLDAGLPVDLTDKDGVTLLDLAVINGRVEMARLFISRGANVNALDHNGMTPLLYAASIDFGDSAMVDLLIKSGANGKTRSKDRLAALDLARKYNNANLVKSLER
ncbi:MAG TPA: ankyrin repeat domain-containing protein [Bryobacteraceae bacterium]|nr:ankyrin repeat domain-containing protein [Bryobacteraceae bacterium]